MVWSDTADKRCDSIVFVSDANGADLSLFMNWYSQVGTPVVTVTQSYDSTARKLVLHLSQTRPSSAGASCCPVPVPVPLLIPVSVGLIDLTTRKDVLCSPVSPLLLLSSEHQSYEFDNIDAMPEADAGSPHKQQRANVAVSLLRGFSAPVLVHMADQSPQELAFLASYDSDGFNRWDCVQRLATQLIVSTATATATSALDEDTDLCKCFVASVRAIAASAKVLPHIPTPVISLHSTADNLTLGGGGAVA